MKWRGETEQQWAERTSDWHRYFCWIPRQMRSGNWVWLEYVWRIRLCGVPFDLYVFSDSVTPPELPMAKNNRPKPPMQSKG